MAREFFHNFAVTDYLEAMESSGTRLDSGLGMNPHLDEQILRDCLTRARWTINAYNTSAYDRLKDRLLHYWRIPGLTRANITLGSGTFGILRTTCLLALGPGRLSLGYAPQFTRIQTETILHNAEYRYVLMKDLYDTPTRPVGRFDSDRFLAAMTPDIRLVYLDNPNNPTGQIIPLAAVESVVAAANRMGCVVLVDEAYGDYMDMPGSAINLVPQYDNLIVSRSASHFWGLPNHRIGYAFTSVDLADIFNRVSNPYPFSDYSTEVFCAMLDRSEDMAISKSQTQQAKAQAMMYLPGLAYTSSRTPLMVLPLPTEKLTARGIVSESCAQYPGLGPQYSRIRIHRDIDSLISVLTYLMNAEDSAKT